MREILFRGKRSDGGGWIYGTPFYARDFHENVVPCIVPTDFDGGSFLAGKRAVDPDTVGQFTGLADKNGKKIFEGDVLLCHTDGLDLMGDPFADGTVTIEWSKFAWAAHERGCSPDLLADYAGLDIAVVGNIHDNPEVI